MSKDLFMAMREAEISTTKFLPSKKEIISSSKAFAESLLDAGETDPIELFAQALRLKEALVTIEKVLKDNISEHDFEAFGLKGKYKSGGEMIQFKEDDIFVELEMDLNNRKELLKLAQKQVVIDGYGNEVPKVSTKPRASSMTITY